MGKLWPLWLLGIVVVVRIVVIFVVVVLLLFLLLFFYVGIAVVVVVVVVLLLDCGTSCYERCLVVDMGGVLTSALNKTSLSLLCTTGNTILKSVQTKKRARYK